MLSEEAVTVMEYYAEDLGLVEAPVASEGLPGEGLAGKGVAGERLPGEGLAGKGVAGERVPEDAPAEEILTLDVLDKVDDRMTYAVVGGVSGALVLVVIIALLVVNVGRKKKRRR